MSILPNTPKIDFFFCLAKEKEASDLYLSVGSHPVLRIHGELEILEEYPILTKEKTEELVLEILSPQQRKKFEVESDLDFAYTFNGVASFRINLFVQRKGLGIACRLIPEKIPDFDTLSLPDVIKNLASLPNGLVLVTGPTGSGKSTTLASIVELINTKTRKHIITIEDPIEFIHENKLSVLEQREVGNHTKSFKIALRAALREDTDVILVGEMRDLDTISLALTAAETGHLVLSTLHTSGAAESISRIIDVFPPEQQNQIRTQLSSTLRAVVWQTLFRSKDGKKRVPAVEILFNKPNVANMIRQNMIHQIPSAIETGRAAGMQTMEKSIENLIEKGLIDENDALRYLQKEED